MSHEDISSIKVRKLWGLWKRDRIKRILRGCEIIGDKKEMCGIKIKPKFGKL